MTALQSTNISDGWALTSLGWQEKNLKIVNKNSSVVALKHNKAQLMFHNAKKVQHDLNVPVRIIICKARQKGLSTAEAADTFEDVCRNDNKHACLISMDIDGTEKVFRMSKNYYQHLPYNLKASMPTDASNRKQIAFSHPHNSSILCQTAGKDVLGRGGTVHRVHATEVAFWRNAERQLAGLLQEVPKTPESSVVIESTSFGTVGAFHNRFVAAVDRARSKDFTGFIPLFIPWHVDDEYSMAIPHGYDMSLYSDHEYYGDEQLLFRKFGVTPEQLYWRRWMIQNDFDNDISWFMQEYPITWRESFQGSGRMVFIPSQLDKMEDDCKPSIANVLFYRDETGTVRFKHVERRANCWSIWRWPDKNHSYCAFADVAEGVLSDKKDPKSAADRSVAGVMDRDLMDVPAVYYGRPDTIEYGDQFLMACEFFNYAWGTPEMNSIGQSVLDTMKRAGYEFIYAREHKQETDNEEDSAKLGWKTTTLTRKPMVTDLKEVVKNHGLKVYDIRVVNELRTFIVNKDGKEEAESGEHDDCVIMLAGCIQMHKRCPLNTDFSLIDERDTRPAGVPVCGEIAGDDDDDDDESYYNQMFEEEEVLT